MESMHFSTRQKNQRGEWGGGRGLYTDGAKGVSGGGGGYILMEPKG